MSPEYSLEGLMLKLKLQYFIPDVKNLLLGEDPDAGKDLGQEQRGMTEDEMVRWHHQHHQLSGHESEETLGAGDGQRALVFCSLWGYKEADIPE